MLSCGILGAEDSGKAEGTVLGAFTYIFSSHPQTGELTSPSYWLTVSPWQSPVWDGSPERAVLPIIASFLAADIQEVLVPLQEAPPLSSSGQNSVGFISVQSSSRVG